ncbi:hypothetical protein K492DRAFT_238661 [Lichtheimia hyalospora FSU 10163]|nr:hypothetical protein K492DRAFT_238661 [Lichtheimia hyalospora FSU 10163]
MTIDTQEYNDPVQIINNLEHDKDNKRKKFFEKGLAALLADPHFILLHVPKDDDDENGKPVAPVSMRPEKRDPLLALFKDYPDSYWWIDVLCAPADTPLDIMGDIYACCLECVAMIDCHPRVIPSLHAMMGARNEFPGLFGSADPILEDLLPYKQLYDKKYPDLMDHLFTLFECQWWNRVWTWQEMILPVGDVRLVAETAAHFSQSNTIVVDELFLSFYNVALVLHYYMGCLTVPDGTSYYFLLLLSTHATHQWKNSKWC